MSDTTLAKPLETYVSTQDVPDGDATIAVPVDSESNRRASRIVGTKLRHLMVDQINKMKKSKGSIHPTALKDFITAAAKVEDINRFAFNALDLDGNGGGGETAKTAEAMMRGAMQGVVAAAQGSDRAKRMRKLIEVGKSKEPEDDIVEIE